MEVARDSYSAQVPHGDTMHVESPRTPHGPHSQGGPDSRHSMPDLFFPHALHANSLLLSQMNSEIAVALKEEQRAHALMREELKRGEPHV